MSNAGWTRLTNFFDLEEQVNEEDWDRCFNVNVKSHLWLLYAAKPYLEVSPGGGSFVTVASLAGVRPSGSSLPYSVTKAAEIHLTKGLVCSSRTIGDNHCWLDCLDGNRMQTSTASELKSH